MLAENQGNGGYNTIVNEYERRLDNIPKIHLTWENITVCKKIQTSAWCRRKKTLVETQSLILDDVSGVAKPGDFIAILGASGSGKTTLLNALSHRLSPGLELAGQVRINGRTLLPEEMRRISGYVGQNDTFVGSMTVIEVVLFYANLKLDSRIPHKEKQCLAETLLQKVGLSHVKNSFIGDSFMPGISGGERTRLVVATQLLLGASLLFLDEVTSGLDTFMAESVLKMMKDLAEWGCTILCTIHQPASELYALFDKVCLITEGRIAFLGDHRSALTFFEESNYPCPPHHCPTDHFIYTLAIKPGIEEKCRERCMEMVRSYKKSRFFFKVVEDIKDSSALFEGDVRDESKIPPTPTGTFWNQLFENIKRSLKENLRNPRSSRSRLIAGVIVALMTGFFYLRTSNDKETVKANKSGLIFLIILIPAVRSLNFCALTIPLSFRTTLREHHNGLYSSLAYFLSIVICEIPYMVSVNFVQFLITWLLVGLKMDAVSFFNAVNCIIITSWASSGAGWLIGAIVGPQPALTSQVSAVAILPFFLFAGVLKDDEGTPTYLYPFKYLSWLRYGFRMMFVNEFRDLELSCGDDVCVQNGTVILLEMGIDPDELWWPNMVANGVLGLGFMVVAWLILASKFKRR